MNQKVSFKCTKCGKPSYSYEGTERAKSNICKDCYGKRKDKRENKLNNLSGKEWAALSKSVEKYEGRKPDKQKQHGASFPLSLAEQQILIYSKKDQVILDPFLGVGTTIDAAANLGRKSVGIEVDSNFADLASQDIIDPNNHKVICDDCRNMTKHLKKESIDFILTSPPYANLLQTIKGDFGYKWREHSEIKAISNPTPYSESNRDLGNLPYDEFMNQLEDIMNKSFEVLKKNSYAVWVVKDYRDLKRKVPYVNFHGDVIKAAENAGFTLWDIRIYDQTQFRPLVVLGYPSRNYYLNIGHSYIISFKKI
ncbi:DNA methylase [Zunongwangia mangrovi]|uniref:Methyltransferase n=1 Tax=Zunongwangia mangrovi TaxID=1334022 RepID=A0A1I1DL42_9FLAO|nr:DNA methyltransferase [Zunongwangia mangrovi]SFB75611.1 DNA methylase [Zunongwangia mangrovi]